MSLPQVVIVGRPNVGKSSIMNWLSRKRISVVEPTAGVTRDRVTYLMHENDRYFELVDTGGIGVVDSDDLSEDIQRQIQTAIEEATLILFVVDGQTGVMPLDQEVARRLRPLGKPVLLVVNKCDSPKADEGKPEISVARMIEENDVVVAEGAVKSRKKGGDAFEAVFCDVFFMRQGKIAKLVTYLMVVP